MSTERGSNLRMRWLPALASTRRGRAPLRSRVDTTPTPPTPPTRARGHDTATLQAAYVLGGVPLVSVYARTLLQLI